MRLTQLLLKWPKNMPNGSIWIGLTKIEEQVHPSKLKQLIRELERERKNSFYLVQPAITKEQEAAIMDKMSQDTPEETLHKLEKQVAEHTLMAPKPLSDHYHPLKPTESWE